MAHLKIGKMVLRSLAGKPATLMYPVVPREWKERTRGRIEIEIDDCIFCGICSRKCPTDAITVKRDEKIWSIERMGCIQCSCCVEACPKDCLTNKAGYTSPGTEKVVDTFVKKEAPEAAAPEKAAPEAAPEKAAPEAIVQGGEISADAGGTETPPEAAAPTETE